MTVEQKLKQIIGEQTFAVVMLQTRIEELEAENASLRPKRPEPPVNPVPKAK